MAHPLAGLLAQEPGPAIEPAPLIIDAGRAQPSAEAAAELGVAHAIAERLQQGGQLRHYCIDITFHDGTAELTGRVASAAQREQVLQLVRGVPGVERVADRLVLVAAGEIMPVQAEGIAQPKEPAPLLPRAPTPVDTTPPVNTNPIVEPLPMGAGMGAAPYDLYTPKMPPYAWPTYAPYNNYSRVAYPLAYPYNAWPYIGPFYPFPKVPLGWRSVKLEWQDGHWWYSKLGTSYDWWRLRYW
jgi:hypothetical protein